MCFLAGLPIIEIIHSAYDLIILQYLDLDCLRHIPGYSEKGEEFFCTLPSPERIHVSLLSQKQGTCRFCSTTGRKETKER